MLSLIGASLGYFPVQFHNQQDQKLASNYALASATLLNVDCVDKYTFSPSLTLLAQVTLSIHLIGGNAESGEGMVLGYSLKCWKGILR